MQVFKFGGASVKDASAVKNVTNILKKFQNEPLLVVISAMGKTTNALEAVLDAYFYQKGDSFAQKGDSFALLDKVKEQHLDTTQQIIHDEEHPVYEQLNDIFGGIELRLRQAARAPYNFVYDQVVSAGELISTRIVSAYLQQESVRNTWIDARQFIRTDNTYREGQVNWAITEQRIRDEITALARQNMVITQGFLGGTIENLTTTLGREGSDYTAAIFAYSLGATKVSIWKDVPGVLNADPRLVPDAQQLSEISYHEAIEMTYYGAKVIHPKTIKPLQNKGITLVVRSFKDHDKVGTTIHKMEERQPLPPIVVIKKNQLLLSIATRDFSFVVEENLSNIYRLFAKHRIKTNLTQNAAISFSACIDYTPNRVKRLLADLEQHYKVLQNKNLSLITVRHYTPQAIQKHTENMDILLEQKSRETIQMVCR